MTPAGDSGSPLVPGTDAGPPDAGGTDAGRRGPPYPVVLVHGFFGFEEFAGLGFATYFFEVREDLNAAGETRVFTPALDPFNTSVVRGAELEAHVERILDETGYEKVNLIGHSQGGIDSRVLAFDRPDLVASVTTIATPHRGTEIADIIARVVANDDLAAIVDQLARVIGAPIYDALGEETSVMQSVRQLTTGSMEEFNRTYLDALGVEYFSVAGRSDLHSGGDDCDVASPEFIDRYRRERDPIDPLFSLTEEIIDGGILAPNPNDGLVTVKSSVWGTFLGCVPADHMDEVGHLLGDSPGIFNDFDHKAFFRGLIAFLRAQGL